MEIPNAAMESYVVINKNIYCLFKSKNEVNDDREINVRKTREHEKKWQPLSQKLVEWGGKT